MRGKKNKHIFQTSKFSIFFNIQIMCSWHQCKERVWITKIIVRKKIKEIKTLARSEQ